MAAGGYLSVSSIPDAHWFPIDQFETGRELAYGFFDTLLVY